METKAAKWDVALTCALLFCAGVLVIYKPCYDYTVIKNVVGFLFCAFASRLFLVSDRRLFAPPAAWYALAAFLAWMLASVSWAKYLYGAGAGIEPFLLYFLIFLIALNMPVEKTWVYLWFGAVFIATLWAFHDQFVDARHYIICSFGNPNFYAGHAMMPALIAVSLLWRRRTQEEVGETALLALFAVAVVSAIVLTQSRAAIVALLFGLCLLPVARPAHPGKFHWARWVPVFLLVAGMVAFWHSIRAQIVENIRFYIWRGTWRLITEHMHSVGRMLNGWGIGNYIFHYPFYRVREYFLQPESTPVTNHAHCEYLELWAELGLIGLVLFVALVGISVAGGFARRTAGNGAVQAVLPRKKAVSQKDDGEWENAAVAGMVCAVVAVMVDNILSTNLRNASTAMYFWFLLGVLAGRHRRRVEYDAGISRMLWGVVCGVSLIMAVFVFAVRVQSEIYLKNGIWAREAHDYDSAIANYAKLVTLDSHHYVGWYKLAFAYGESGHRREAMAVYHHINTNVFPHFAKTDANLGNLHLRQAEELLRQENGRFTPAVMDEVGRSLLYLKWAEYLNPYDEDVLCTIASIHLIYYRDKKTAREYLRRVLTFKPENEYALRALTLMESEEHR